MGKKVFSQLFAIGTSALLACFALTLTSFATTTINNFSPSFGTVGTTVTIYGTNFGSSAGTVSFNGTSATVSSWGASSITVTVPTSATTGLVSVTPSGGSAVSSTGAFIVLASNAGLAMGAFPPTGATCSGIGDYSGSNCYHDYLNDVLPNIDGVVVEAEWSAMDPGNGNAPCYQPGGGSSTCNFTSLDNAVNDFVQANLCGSNKTSPCWSSTKKVGIVISPVSDGGCNGDNCNTSTPAYVFTSAWATTAGGSGTPAVYQCNCQDYQGDSGAPIYPTCWQTSTTNDTSGFPVVYETPFSVALQDFHDAVIAHVNSSTYAPYVAYVRLGTAGGGEEYPHCSSEIKSYFGISDTTLKSDWTTYAGNVFTNASKQGAQYALMAAPNGNGSTSGDPSDYWADAEADDALSVGLALGSEGLQSNDIFVSNCDTSTSTDGGSSNNWCYTFSSAFDTNNKVTAPSVKELQTLMYSDPAEGPPTTNLNCQTNEFNSGNTTSENTGSIVCLLPFVQGKANSIELYPEDVFLAFDSSTTGYSTYGSDYATAISNLRTGN
jgi:hypothetical protein